MARHAATSGFLAVGTTRNKGIESHMKATSSFRNAVSAAALSAALVVPGALAGQLVAVQSAYAAVVSSIDVRGNQRVDDNTIREYLGITPNKSVLPPANPHRLKTRFAC